MRVVFFIVLIVFAVSCDTTEETFSPIDIIPFSSSVIIETNDLTKVQKKLQQSDFNKIISKTLLGKTLKNNFDSVISFLKKHKFNYRRKILISVIDIGPNNFDFLWIVPVKKISSIDLFSKLNTIGDISHLSYDDEKITKVNFYANNIPNLYFFIYKKTLIFSTKKILLEDAIKHIHSSIKIKNNKEFSQVYKLKNDNAIANIFINYKYVNRIITQLFPKLKFRDIDRLANWTTIDLEISSKIIGLTGVTVANDSVPHFLNIFKNVPQKQIILDKFLPTSIASATIINIGDLSKYQKYYTNYLDILGKYNSLKNNLDNYAFDVNQLFFPWVNDEISIFQNQPQANPISNQLAMILSKSPNIAEENLKELCDSIYTKYRGHIIYKSKYKSILRDVFGDIFKKIRFPYFVITPKFVIFANNLEQIKSFLNHFMEDKTLYLKNDYLKIKDHLLDKSNILIIGKNPSVTDWLKTILYRKNANQIPTDFSNIKFGALQITVEDDIFFTNTLSIYNENKETEIQQLWVKQLQNPIRKIISLPINHYTKQKEIFVQDNLNIVHLIDSKGQLLWSKKIEEPILGNANQVDLFQNKKLQIIFNTKNYIYIFDRNGELVRKLKLSQSTNFSMAIFDYDKIRNYRFLITIGKKLYMYDKFLKPVKGFEFKGSRDKITSKPKHYRVNNRDYIIFKDNSNYLYFLNRRGENRIKINKKLQLSSNEIYFNYHLKNWITTTNIGNLIRITTNGKILEEKFKTLTPQHHFEYINKGTLIFDKAKINFLNNENSFDTETPSSIQKIKGLQVNENTFFCYVNSENNKVYILDKTGDLLENFPIYGSSLPVIGDIDKDGKYNILTISEDGILLNYTMNK